MATDGPTPAPCNPKIFKRGTVVGMYETFGANHFEGLIAKVRKQTGRGVDWHYAGGRAIVKAMPIDAHLVESAVKRIVEPAIMARRELLCSPEGMHLKVEETDDN